MTARRTLKVLRLGRVEYPDGLVLQAQLARARRAGTVGDVLLLLEHPPNVMAAGGAATWASGCGNESSIRISPLCTF